MLERQVLMSVLSNIFEIGLPIAELQGICWMYYTVHPSVRTTGGPPQVDALLQERKVGRERERKVFLAGKLSTKN